MREGGREGGWVGRKEEGREGKERVGRWERVKEAG